MKMYLKRILRDQPWFRPLRRGYSDVRALLWGQPDWSRLLARDRTEWVAALAAAQDKRKILIATSVGGHLACSTLESMLAVALTLRGAEVHVLLCDEALPACMACEIDRYPRLDRFVERGPAGDQCRYCYGPAARMLRSLGLKVLRYGEWASAADLAEADWISRSIRPDDVRGLQVDGIAAGEHAYAGALRFFARGTLETDHGSSAVLRRNLSAALITTRIAQRLLRESSYDCVVLNHGIYVPQGVISEVARHRKIRVVTWNPAYRKQRFIFSHGDTYHHTLMHEPVSHWENLALSGEAEAELDRYLKSRWTGMEDWIWFHDRPKFDLSGIERELGVNFSKPCVGLLTNVIWDAQLHYPANAFPTMLDWLVATIRFFEERPDLQLIIRVHPAEIHGGFPSRQRVVDEINGNFPRLPQNVFVIPPESRISTYVVMSQCNAVVIYGTKTGVELTSMGIPVIVAGESWIRNKGVTMDAGDPRGYFDLLRRLPLKTRMEPAVVARARRYAYHFFCRRMIPLESMQPRTGWPPYRIDLPRGMDSLRPGASHGLDVVCDGILKGSEFIYPAERMGNA